MRYKFAYNECVKKIVNAFRNVHIPDELISESLQTAQKNFNKVPEIGSAEEILDMAKMSLNEEPPKR
jgi:hypothetical protein